MTQPIPTPAELEQLRGRPAADSYLHRLVGEALTSAPDPAAPTVTLPVGVTEDQFQRLETELQRRGWRISARGPAVAGVSSATWTLAPADRRERPSSDPPWIRVVRTAPTLEEAARRLGLTAPELTSRLSDAGQGTGIVGAG